jgi:hypothetical protein
MPKKKEQKREREKNKDSPYFQKLQRERGMTKEYKNLEKNYIPHACTILIKVYD